MPKVSVIIPVYNTEKYLRKCLDSVCGQTLSDIEIICINDCSPDNATAILTKYAQNDNRIQLVNFDKNKGVSVARNTGIDMAQGEYIAFVDSDDFVDLDFYEKLYEKAIETKAEVVVGNIKYFSEIGISSSNFLEKVKENKFYFNGLFVLAIYNRQLLKTNNITFTKEIKYGEDRFLPIQAVYFANTVKYVESAYYYYVNNNKSISRKMDFKNLKDFFNITTLIINYINKLNLNEDSYFCIGKSFLDQCYWMLSFKDIDFCEPLNTGFIDNYKYPKHIDFNMKSIFELIRNNSFEQIATKIKHDNKKNMISLLRAKMQTIPKRIFYVWIGGNKPTTVHMCIENWKDKLAQYEIIEVNETSQYFNFEKTYNECEWFRVVYDRKMWAYVSDYIRCKVIYEHGGVYLDTDVTIYKDISPLLNTKMFIGKETDSIISAGIFGAVKKHPFFKDMLDFYENKIFNSELYRIPSIMSYLHSKNNYNIKIYDKEYFYPYYYNEEFKPSCITENTYTVHWWSASWVNEETCKWLESKNKIELPAFEKKKFYKVKVSIVIPVYNVETYLRTCLDSVCRQTLKDIEIICVNDCSPDESLAILEEYKQKDSRIVLVNREQNGGLSAARNSGMQVAQGEYIGFVDSDDWIDEDYFEKMYYAGFRNNVEIVLNTNIIKCFEDGIKEDFSWAGYPQKKAKGEYLETSFSCSNTHCMSYLHIYKREFIEKNNLKFPEGYIHEDNYFKAVTELYTDKIFAFYGSIYYYLQRQNSIMNESSASIVSKIKIFNKILDYYEENNYMHNFNTQNLIWLFNKQCKNNEEFIHLKKLAKKLKNHFDMINKTNETHINFFFDAVLSSKNFSEYSSLQKKDIRLYILRSKFKGIKIKS